MKCYYGGCNETAVKICKNCGNGMCKKHQASVETYIYARRSQRASQAKTIAIEAFSKNALTTLCQLCRLLQADEAERAFLTQHSTVDIFYHAVEQVRSRQPITTPERLPPKKLVAAWLSRAKDAKLKSSSYKVEVMVSKALPGSRQLDEYKQVQVRGWHFRLSLASGTATLVIAENGKSYLNSYPCTEQELEVHMAAIFVSMVEYLARHL